MNALVIANTQIRRDPVGRYCLNDLHQASGGAARHQPPRWFRLDQAKDLIAEIKGERYPEVGSGTPPDEPLVAIEGGLGQGTYAIKELVYAYAMWISPKFHLHVIRAYDALQQDARAGRGAAAGDTAPSHRADVLVGAARGFGALVKAGRIMGLARSQAVRAANEATLRTTGVDLVQELGAEQVTQAPALARHPGEADTVGLFHAALQAGELPVPYVPCMSRDAFYLYQHWCRTHEHTPDHLPRFVQRLRVEQGVPVDRRRYLAPDGIFGPVGVLLWGEPAEGSAELGGAVLSFRTAVDAVIKGTA